MIGTGSANLSSSPHEGKQWPAIEFPLPLHLLIPQHGISIIMSLHDAEVTTTRLTCKTVPCV